jgi:hypothetical protein
MFVSFPPRDARNAFVKVNHPLRLITGSGECLKFIFRQRPPLPEVGVLSPKSVCFYPEPQISLITLRLAAVSPWMDFLRGGERCMPGQLLHVAQRNRRLQQSSSLFKRGNRVSSEIIVVGAGNARMDSPLSRRWIASRCWCGVSLRPMTLAMPRVPGVRLIVWRMDRRSPRRARSCRACATLRHRNQRLRMARQAGLFPVWRPPRRDDGDWNPAANPSAPRGVIRKLARELSAHAKLPAAQSAISRVMHPLRYGCAGAP